MVASVEETEWLTIKLATKLSIGDSIIGADESEYLIEEIDTDDSLQEYVLHAVNERGQAVKTQVPFNASVHTVSKRAEQIEGQEFGMKLCDNCGHSRSKTRYWTYDDYICKVCRQALDSQIDA